MGLDRTLAISWQTAALLYALKPRVAAVCERRGAGLATHERDHDCRTTLFLCRDVRRPNKKGPGLCAFVDEAGALRPSGCKTLERTVYCEFDLPVCP